MSYTAPGGRPCTAAFEKDGSQYLLYTATWADQGFSDGEAGVVRLVDGDFTWVWPVEGDVRDSRSQAYEDYHDYWEGKKPLMAPGGVEIFTENQDYGIYEGSPVQWVPAQNEVFWLTDEEDLPTGVYDQSRAWLGAVHPGPRITPGTPGTPPPCGRSCPSPRRTGKAGPERRRGGGL